MIDIIIPAYNAHDTIFQTLFSVAYQKSIKLCNVIIVNDNSDKNYNDVVKYFSNFMNIKELILKDNKGPGYARQYGIDNSNNKYIVFIDSDDIFSSPFSIDILYNAINNSKCDIVISDFEEETDDEFILNQNDRVWLHGKIYRRSFLEKNNIRFNNSRQNEDNGFNQLIFLSAANIGFINKKTYIWRNNKQSITRNNNFKYNGIKDYIYNINWALEIAEEKNYDKNRIVSLAFSSLVYLYFIYLEFSNDENILEQMKEVKKTKDFFNVEFLSDKEAVFIMQQQYKDYYNENTKDFLLEPIITFNQFLDLIEGDQID